MSPAEIEASVSLLALALSVLSLLGIINSQMI